MYGWASAAELLALCGQKLTAEDAKNNRKVAKKNKKPSAFG
jgi:hypothetical protein